MKNTLINILIVIGMVLAFVILVIIIAGEVARSQPAPVPSYSLPEQGTITQFGPDGNTVIYYQDHGRSYQAITPHGFETQQQFGNDIIRVVPDNRNGVQFEHGSLFNSDDIGNDEN